MESRTLIIIIVVLLVVALAVYLVYARPHLGTVSAASIDPTRVERFRFTNSSQEWEVTPESFDFTVGGKTIKASVWLTKDKSRRLSRGTQVWAVTHPTPLLLFDRTVFLTSSDGPEYPFLAKWPGVKVEVKMKAWYFYMRHGASSAEFDPTTVESFRIAGSPNEWVVTENSHPYQDGSEKKSELIWKSTAGNLIMFRNAKVWTLTYGSYLQGVIDGGDGGIATSTTADQYPFLSDWGGKAIDVKLKGQTTWTPLASLLTPTMATPPAASA